MEGDIEQIKIFVILLKFDDEKHIRDEKRFSLTIPSCVTGKELFEKAMSFAGWDHSLFQIKSFRKFIKEFDEFEDSSMEKIIEGMQKYEIRIEPFKPIQVENPKTSSQSVDTNHDDESDIIEKNVLQQHDVNEDKSDDEIGIPFKPVQVENPMTAYINQERELTLQNKNLKNQKNPLNIPKHPETEKQESDDEYYEIGEHLSPTSLNLNNVSNEILKRRFLGYRLGFGELYDAITDNFCGSNILSGAKFPMSAIQTEPNGRFIAENVDNLTAKSKITLLQLENELALSYICGMEKSNECTKFLFHPQTIEENPAYTLVFSHTSQTDKLNLAHPKIEPILKDKADLIDSSATHVVIGVEYGFVMPMTVHFDWAKAQLDTAELFNEYIKASINFIHDKLNGKIICRIDSSIELFFKNCAFIILYVDGASNPTTLQNCSLAENVNEILKRSESILRKNKERGVPIGYQLQPLYSLFAKKSNIRKLYLINQTDQTEAVSSFLHLNKILDRFSHFSSFLSRNKAFIENSVITNSLNFQKEVDSEAEIIRKKLNYAIKDIRSGAAHASILHLIIGDCTTLIEKINSFIVNKGSLWKRIDFINELIRETGILYVGKDSRWQDQLKDQEDYFVFFASFEDKDQCLTTYTGCNKEPQF